MQRVDLRAEPTSAHGPYRVVFTRAIGRGLICGATTIAKIATTTSTHRRVQRRPRGLARHAQSRSLRCWKRAAM